MNDQHPVTIAAWIRNHALVNENITPYQIPNPDKDTKRKKEEDAILERLANRKGYSYINNETPPANSPATMKAYYAAQQYPLRIEEQKKAQDMAREQAAMQQQIMTLQQAELYKKMEKERQHLEKKEVPLKNRVTIADAIDEQLVRRTAINQAYYAAYYAAKQTQKTEIVVPQIVTKSKESMKELKNIRNHIILKEEPSVHAVELPTPHVVLPTSSIYESKLAIAKRKSLLASQKLHDAIQKQMIKPAATLLPYYIQESELVLAKRKSLLASHQLDAIFQAQKWNKENPIDTSIHIFLLCFNESVLLPHTVAHYRRNFPSCHITIYDNESSDSSVRIAKELGCHVISWTSYQINDESLKIKIRNQCWKHITTGWIIMADMDEWIYATEEQLKEEEEKGTSVLSIEGLEMIGESQTIDCSDIQLDQIQRYIPFSDESKNICFLRNKIQLMNFGPGSHTCAPKGMIQFSTTVYQLRHMCNLGLPFLLHKMKERYKRSALNRSKGWSIHYTNDEKKITEKYMKLLDSKKIDL